MRHDFVVPADHAAHTSGQRAGAAHDQYVFDAFRALDAQRAIDIVLERHALAAAQAFVRGDHQTRIAVRYSATQRLGGEAREHNGVNGSDARAGEHRNGDFRNHRQVYRDAIALDSTPRDFRAFAHWQTRSYSSDN